MLNKPCWSDKQPLVTVLIKPCCTDQQLLIAVLNKPYFTDKQPLFQCSTSLAAVTDGSLPRHWTGGIALVYHPLLQSSPVTRSALTSDPHEDHAVVLQAPHVEPPQLIIHEGAVGQVLVDLPGRVCHDHAKLAQDAEI